MTAMIDEESWMEKMAELPDRATICGEVHEIKCVCTRRLLRNKNLQVIKHIQKTILFLYKIYMK